jgi:very-short-patch-repair endonuclease
MDPMRRLWAAWRRLPSGAAFTGLTAAWLHGIDVNPCNPIEVLMPPDAGVSGRAGMTVRRSAFSGSEIVLARGFPAASVRRSMLDICATRSLVEATVVADAALHTGRVTFDDLAAWIRSNPHRRGIRKLRRVLELAEPATESPMETRLRLLLVLGGLPRPKVQVTIGDRRVDLYYEDVRLGIEYDGLSHRGSFEEDLQRQNELLRAGVRLLRFTARDVLGDPESVRRHVRAMLHETSAGRNRVNPARAATSAGRSSKSDASPPA